MRQNRLMRWKKKTRGTAAWAKKKHESKSKGLLFFLYSQHTPCTVRNTGGRMSAIPLSLFDGYLKQMNASTWDPRLRLLFNFLFNVILLLFIININNNIPNLIILNRLLYILNIFIQIIMNFLTLILKPFLHKHLHISRLTLHNI